MKNSSIYLLALKIIFFIFLFTSKEANASHVAGGYIQMECTGTPGVYNVKLILYRDCSGVTLGANQSVEFSNTCGINDFRVNLTQTSVTEVSQVCPEQQNNTTCNGGHYPGYEQYIFEGTVTLDDCDTWSIGYSICCRNSTQNVNGQPTFFISTQINTATDNCNDSPEISGQPEPYVCVNQPVSYNLGAFEPNGDSIVYSLIPAATNLTNNVNYQGGFAGNSPIPGAFIDPVSGTVTFTPTVVGAYIFVIQMTEYNDNGEVVTITEYEYQVYVENCSNQTPQGPTAGVSNVTGSIVQNGPNDLSLCQGQNGCFDVVFNDPDTGDELTVNSNISSILPGATVTTTGTNPLVLTVCWTPTTTQGTQTLNFLVEDDACPIQGQNNHAVTINVVDPGVIDVVTTTEPCLGTDQGSATLTVTGGSGPYTYEISGPQTATNTTGVFNNLAPGNYNYTVSNSAGCDLTGTFTITPGSPMPVTTSFVDLTCNNAGDGSATISPVGGVAPYTYDWTQGGTPVGQTSQTISNLSAGTYDVTVTDGVGCTADESIVVSEPDALTGTTQSELTLCNGSADGEISVISVAGGTPTYSYSLNNGTPQTSSVFTGLSAGSYQIEISDSKGCSLTLNETVNEPSAVQISLSNSEDATCALDNGEFEVNATGGTPNYTFSNGGAYQNSGTFTGLASGIYTVVVMDDNGCTDTVEVQIDDVVVPTAAIDNQTNVTCYGGSDGTVTVSTLNAVPTVNYAINGGPQQTSNLFTGLSAGAYTLEIEDGNGCTASTSVTIQEPTEVTFTATVNDALCNGSCDGEIIVNATGGNGPYTYSSDNGVSFINSNTLNNLCAGNIDVVVSDASGCLAQSVEIINEPTLLTATLDGIDPLCKDGNDGEIEVIANGGTPPFSYSINGGSLQSNAVFSGLTSGTYSITVEDDNGCQFTVSETLNNPPGIPLTEVLNTPSNCGFNDGALEVSASGVNPPFQYSINGSVYQSSGSFPNIVGGAYQITVMDDLGCLDSAYFGVNDVQMLGNLVSTTDITCYGGNDGAVEVENVGGATPIVFEVDNNGITQPTGVFTGLTAGGHIATITDNGFCVVTIPFTLTQPDQIDFNGVIQDVDCFGESTGQIDVVNVVGGSGVYEYSIDGGTTYQLTGTFTGLSANSYTIIVRDDNGCTESKTFNVQESSEIQIVETVADLDCFNDNSGEIHLLVSGGTPGYTYSKDNGISFQNSPDFLGIAAGTYDIVVEDALGCQMAQSIVVNEPTAVTSTFTITDTECYGSCDGEVVFNASGGTPGYVYSIDNGVNTTINSTIGGICASSFTATVTDANGCVYTENLTVAEPDSVEFTSTENNSICSDPNGEITITAVGGTPGYSYSIDNGVTFQASNVFTGLNAGNYALVVEDNNGCSASGSQTVTDEPSPVINLVTGTDPLCFGGSDGQVVVNATGGTGGLFYTVNGGTAQASATLTGLPVGTHIVTVEDANGCTDTEQFTLGQPTQLSYTSVPTPLTCYQNSTGSIDVTATGGTPSYQYSFDGGLTFNTSTSLNFVAAGTYDIVVKDNNGCTVSGQETIIEPTELVLNNTIVTDAVCASDCNGEISLDVSGGTLPYSYNWVQGVAGTTDSLAINLCSDNYDIIIEDGNGCQIVTDAFVDEPDSVEITNVVKSNVTCFGDCDGEIEVISPTASEYSMDGGATFQNSNTFSGLCADDYLIVAKDVDGCLVQQNVNIWEADQLELELTDDTTVCNNYNYQLVGTATGGIQPYIYQWGNGGSTTDTLPIIASQTETYTLTIFDQNGCTVPTDSVTVTVIPIIDLQVSLDTTICPEGQAAISAQASDGLPAYSYQWNTGETTNQLNVNPGADFSYIVTATDQCGDQVTDTIDVLLHNTPEVHFEADVLSGCIPLSVNFSNTTDPNDVGTNCIWSIDGQTFNDCSGINYVFDEQGCYDVNLQVESQYGCLGDTTYIDYICVDEYPTADFFFNPENPTVINNEVSFTNNSYGETFYDWSFETGETSTLENPNVIFDQVEIGKNIRACLKVTSRFGCEDEICKIIQFKDDFVLYVPNTFTPDFDDHNQSFVPNFPPGSNITSFQMMIFNRWGETVFESLNPRQGWDGTYGANGNRPAEEGTYIWKIVLTVSGEFEEREYQGHVNLLK
ncbi:T9SS type B sorting domain-containing protein [Brumimicrobium aurantiacum]|uniref:PKD/Chitinase domain-containing protein n=1 Tax=Brumimicrobium aurantiacum TaxID=1737063 RepID=A0A3E1EY36_9FLAO|nr:gliding motility-associated C-terminal domain-containing protein [Brumimicrobium aurantiacum]RFC54454.1 hypothetical protein DXU93_08500 [Brumimicrobium aurantiacum]